MENQILSFKGQEVKMAIKDDKTYWCGKDVCKILDIQNNRKALSTIPDKYKDLVSMRSYLGGFQKTICINESGLYQLVFKSTKPEAVKFREWILEDVLPCIRKYGQYPEPQVDVIKCKNPLMIRTETDLQTCICNYLREY